MVSVANPQKTAICAIMEAQVKAAPAGNRGLTKRSAPWEGDRMATDQSSLNDGGPTSVYRYYDKHGVLLYVGITGRGLARNSEHNKTKEWWQYVTRQEVEHYKTRRAAHNIEKELIRQHRPPFNVQHNPGCAETRDAYLSFRNAHRPIDVNALLRRKLGSPNRLYLDVALVHGDIVTLTSHPEDGTAVRALSFADVRFDIASGGRRARMTSIGIEDGLLRIVVRVADAQQCGGGELMIRLGKLGVQPTLKRLELYLPPRKKASDR